MAEKTYDLCVIGGGINGVGVARDAAMRGLSVVLLEAKDLAGATSSATSKMLHGGVRYLEHGELRMVKEALEERYNLIKLAPHICQPADFVLPDMPDSRPAWKIRLGLYLYDFLACKKNLKRSRRIALKDDDNKNFSQALKESFEKGFLYSDGYTNDARLTVITAKSAAENGAEILTRSPCTGLKCKDGVWQVEHSGKGVVEAKAVVNAAGPFVNRFLGDVGLQSTIEKHVLMSKGSHIVVRRPETYRGNHSYLLQQKNDRVTFVWPHEKDFLLIGTTEEKFEGSPYDAGISQTEIDYLIGGYNDVFRHQISESDIVKTYSGVRPLIDDAKGNAGKASRDFIIYDHAEFDAPLFSVYGGKLTTYRLVAEKIIDKLAPDKKCETAHGFLPGGDIPDGDLGAFTRAQQERYRALPTRLVARYARTYGTCMDEFLRASKPAEDLKISDLGECYGADIYEVEVAYLMAEEFARNADDVLWRRTKQGLYADAQTIINLEQRMNLEP